VGTVAVSSHTDHQKHHPATCNHTWTHSYSSVLP